ncbi:MAG: RDD family protein [Mycobacterium sp.]
MTEQKTQRAAGIVSRGVAAVVDFLVVGTMLAALYVGLVLAKLVVRSTAFSFPSLNVVFSSTAAFVVSVLYLVACWSVSGCTAGAVLMGLRVVGRRRSRLTFPVSLLRAVTCVLFPVGLLWVAVDRQRRSLQDIVFGSRVVYARP